MVDDPAPPPDAGPGSSGVFDDRPTGDVIASLVANVQGLVRTEVELAKLELSAIARDKAIAIGAFVTAGLLGLFVLGFVGVTVAVALQLVMPAWLAWLLVTLLYAVLGGIGALVGVRMLRRPSTPERTKADLQRTADWAKQQVQR